MKGKIVAQGTYQIGNATYVQKETKYGTFTGKVKLSEEDLPMENSFDGYRFAEQKCDIQAYHEKAKRLRERAIGIEHAYNVLEKAGIDPSDYTMFKLRRQVTAAWEEYERTYETYTELRDCYYDWVEIVQQSRLKMREMKKNQK